MVLVEHDMQFVGALAERVVVLDRGSASPTGRRPRSGRPAASSPPTSAPRFPMTALVDVSDLVVRYGPAVALDGVSLTLGPGERVALMGANGAGKSRFSTPSAASYGPPPGRSEWPVTT